jgi:hypothetical protein
MVSPITQVQVSDCSTFLIMRDVPDTGVFCKESVECLLGIVVRFIFVLYLQFLLLQMINGMSRSYGVILH